jgi:hypothetical protein
MMLLELLSGLVLCAASAASGEPVLLLDDAPSFTYRGGDITISLRVVNPAAAERPLGIRCSLRGSDGKAAWTREVGGRAPAAGSWRTELTCRLNSRASTAPELLLELTADGRRVDTSTLRVLRPDAELPELKASEGKLLDGARARVVFEIERRVRPPSTRWMFVRWLRKKMTDDVIRAPDLLLLADELGQPPGAAGGYIDQLAKDVAGLQAVHIPTTEGLGSLRAVEQAFREKLPEAQMAVLFIGNQDYEWGGDVLDYRRSLELIIQRLEARGVGSFVIIPPIAPRHWRDQAERYRRVAGQVAWDYSARLIDLGGLRDDTIWLREEGTSQVYLRNPSERGHRVIARTIADELAKIRRP